MKDIINCIKKEININNDIIIIDTIEEQLKYLNRSKMIFTFGSSSIFELWCMGLRNIKVISFFSNDRRSQQFIDFKDLYIESYFNYVSIINDLNNNDDKYSNKLNDLFSFYNSNNSNLLTQFIKFIDKHEKKTKNYFYNFSSLLTLLFANKFFYKLNKIILFQTLRHLGFLNDNYYNYEISGIFNNLKNLEII